MTQKTSTRFLRRIAIVLFFFSTIAAGLLFSSFRTAEKLTDDVWKMLGISKQSGDDKIKNSFINGYLYYYGVKNIKSLATNDRATIAKNLLNYTKEYISSPAFVKQYEDWRKGAKPMEPQLKPLRTIEQIQKEEIEKTEKSIKSSEKTMKELPDLAKSMQPLMDMLKKNLKEYQDPKNPYFASIAMGEKLNQDDQIKSYNNRMKDWEKAWPADIKLFIAERLQRMLDATKDIDYAAALKENKEGKKIFVNSRYEYKNQEWKQGFRAGKEVTEPARAFAEKWLSELQAK